MKRLGLSRVYSILLRLSVGLLLGGLISKLPQSWFTNELSQNTVQPQHPLYDSVYELLQNSLYESFLLSSKSLYWSQSLYFS